MKKSNITIQSHWKKDLKNEYFTQGSSTLVIMLPGNNYSIKGPLFYYLTGMYLEEGFDIIQINYGYQIAQVALDFKDIHLVLEESKATLKQLADYEHVIIVGKSMGTAFIDAIASDYKSVRKIYLTPTDQSLTRIKDDKGLYIYGSQDPLLTKREQLSNRQVLVIKNANHSLRVGHYASDLTNMKIIIEEIQKYSQEEKNS